MNNTISYCTTCKGRLWQLQQTLPSNLQSISNVEGVDLILLDYHSDDGLEDWVKTNFQDYLNSGKLKYYKLLTQRKFFDASYAKNVAHIAANGDVLFNLDADNFIGNTIVELQQLKSNEVLINGDKRRPDRMGRIGTSRDNFIKVRGYNELMKNVVSEDTELLKTLKNQGLEMIESVDESEPIRNSLTDKHKFSSGKNSLFFYSKHRNVRGFGIAELENHLGEIIRVGEPELPSGNNKPHNFLNPEYVVVGNDRSNLKVIYIEDLINYSQDSKNVLSVGKMQVADLISQALPTTRSIWRFDFSDQLERMSKVDLNQPILLHKGKLIDGCHRIVTAYLLGFRDLEVINLKSLPEYKLIGIK